MSKPQPVIIKEEVDGQEKDSIDCHLHYKGVGNVPVGSPDG